ncbi:HupE/UreJ family protein [Dactylosporangium sp. NPDC000244]|uniref:HupE/UreJ family protein n=1 Tax=Dactylosporangium sp. NPDC000244 TaxID=3154365 RepID=UPI00332E48F6
MSRIALLGLAAVLFAVLWPSPAGAHGFSSTVYADVTAEAGRIHTDLQLEYDLLVVSAADAERDDALFREGTAAFEAGDTTAMAAALNAHAERAGHYVTERFTIRGCTAAPSGTFTMGEREGVPYATTRIDWTCPQAGGHLVEARLFPDGEGYVKDVKTIVTYALDGRHGSAALDSGHPTFDTGQRWYQRFWEFFRLGAEHLLTGIDHILFLVALIAGSRRLRDIVLAATSFTLAHSVTFMLAALGLVAVPAGVVEPVIALSIAVVAAMSALNKEATGNARLAVVFCFGLIHGLGFAGALGIDEPFSWTLLWSLLVFNVGIEAVQLGLIGLTFPLLLLLRRKAPETGRWVTGAVATGVALMGLVWFFQRL